MRRRLVLTDEAQAEFDEAFDYYERQRSGMGDAFDKSVRDSFKLIVRRPLTFAKIFRDVRKTRVAKFPYAIFYHLEGATIVVDAVFHSSRDPKVWQSRIPLPPE